MKNKMHKPLKIMGLMIALWAIGYGLYVASILSKSAQAPDKRTDAIVVLTGGGNRIHEGLKLFANAMAPELFITGVYPSVKKADIVKTWTQSPLPVCCVTLGYEATTTVQNAQETKKWIADKGGIKSIRLVTANYHMNRALLEFKHELKGIEIYAHPFVQAEAVPSKRWFWMITLEEYHKSIIRWVTFILTTPGTGHGHSHNQAHGEHG